MSQEDNKLAECKPAEETLSPTDARIEEQTTESLELLSRHILVFDNLSEAVIITDAASQIVDWNSGARRRFGYHKSEVLGKSPAILHKPEDGNASTDLVERVTSSRRWSGEMTFIHKDGSEVFCESAVTALRDRQGTVIGTVGVHRDITQHKRMMADLQWAYQCLRFHVENSPLAVVEWDQEFRVSGWSPKAESLFGWRADEVLGKQPTDWRFVYAQDVTVVEGVMARLLDGSESSNVSINRNYAKDGSVVHCEWYNSALLDESGNLVSILSLLQDTTERERADQVLRESKEELRVLSGELINAQEKERKRIASELHDGIGQSLAAIKFELETYLHKSATQSEASDLRQLEGLIRKIQNAGEEVRRISMDLRPSTLDDLGILSTFDWFLREYASVYPSVRVDRRLGVGESDIPTVLKPVVYRIAQEALNNVAKHADATSVAVELTRNNAGITLRIEDDGQGFLIDNLSSGGRHGVGVGLKSMRERAEYSGGVFRIRSSRGIGTTITVTWPEKVR